MNKQIADYFKIFTNFGHMILLSLLLLNSTQAIAQKENEAGMDSVVASTSYSADNVSYHLILRKKEIVPLSNLDILDFFRKHSDQNVFPNTVFMITKHVEQNETISNMVWVAYVNHQKAGWPWQKWSADFVWSPERKRGYVVIVKSIGWHVTLSVYEFDPNNEIGAYPLDLDLRNYEQWPKAADPITQKEETLLWKEISGISKINVSIEGDELVIWGEREHAHIPPARFRYNLNANEWAQIVYDEIKGSSDF